MTVIQIVIGTLGTTPKKLKKRLEDIGIEIRVTELQKTMTLNSVRILRKVLRKDSEILSNPIHTKP